MRNSTFLLVLFFIIACGEDKSEDKTSQEEIDVRANIIYDSTRAEERKLFLEKYNPSSISDSTFKYTYQLQEAIFTINNLHKIKGNIVDIIKRGQVYYIKIVGEFANEEAFLELSITSEMLDKISTLLEANKKFEKAEFIFEIFDFNTSSGFDAEPFSSESSYFNIKYDFLSVTYFINGKLVDLLPSN